MVVISAGMPKSGTAYFYSILNQLMIASGHADARLVKEKYGLDGTMRHYNNNIGEMSWSKLARLWRVSLKEGPFVVKTHDDLSRSAVWLNTLGAVRIVYSYRDPRDVILSAMDHGKRILERGETHTFARMAEFESALEFASGWLVKWRKYAATPGVLTVKYEHLMEDPLAVVNKLVSFLGLSVSEAGEESILWSFSPDNPEADRRGMHFNKAIAYRYRTEMTRTQQAACEAAFAAYLPEMGYTCS